MPKKQKRQVSQNMVATNPESAAKTGPTYMASSASRRISTGEFKPDYTYIIKDLRRIGILAGSFFGILVILSFFLK